jgi:hypothetical protein
MNDLKRLEGKIIDSVREDNDGASSYFVIKFEDGTKLNIVSYLNGDKGLAQLDVDTAGLKPNQFLGKQILKFTEEFDGEIDHLFMDLKGGHKIEFTPFSSSEDSTAGLETFVYSGDKIVAESLMENSYLKWGQYSMSQPQYEEGETPERRAQEIVEELEEWLVKQRIHDEDEELTEVEAWLIINTDDEPGSVRRKVMELVTQKYDINPKTLG